MAVRKPATRERAAGRRTSTKSEELPEPRELTAEEAWALYDAAARELLGVSAEEFETQLARGQFNGAEENRDAVAVWMVRACRPGS
jgi:hypothetical protein